MSRIKERNSFEDKKKASMEFFLSRGYAPEHAAGIVANLIHESGLDHTIGTGDQGNAYGLAQWNIEGSPERYSNFEKIFNKSLYESTFEEQLEYIDWELNNTEKRAMAKLLETTNPMDAALVVSEFYERPYGARGRNIEQIREQYRKEAKKGIKAYHHNPKREQYATDLYLNYDDNIYAVDSNGKYVTLNPNVATEQDIQNSGVIKKQFYNEYLTNLQRLEETPIFTPQEDTFFVSNNEDVVPVQNITNNYYYESNDSEQPEEKPNEVTEAKKKLNEKQFLVDLIKSGALNLQNPEYKRVPTMQDGGQIPTSSQGLYEYPNQTVKVPTKDGRITMKNIPYPVVGISAETGEQILMYPNQEYQFKNTKNVIEIPLSHYNTNKNMQEGGNISYETTVPILQADGSIIYENVRGQGYTFANGGYVNGFEDGGGINHGGCGGPGQPPCKDNTTVINKGLFKKGAIKEKPIFEIDPIISNLDKRNQENNKIGPRHKTGKFEHIKKFNYKEDLGFFTRNAARIFAGDEKLQKIQGIYNQLVEYKNKRPEGAPMSPEEKQLRENIVKAQKFGYPRGLKQLNAFADRVLEGKEQSEWLRPYRPNWEKMREALNRKYFGLDYDERLLEESKYKPSNSENPNASYIDFYEPARKNTIKNLRDVYPTFEDLYQRFRNGPQVVKYTDLIGERSFNDDNDSPLSHLNNFTMGSGEDEKGRYISYYDIWDIELPGLEEVDIDKLNYPYEIYGRIYEKDYNIDNKPNKKKEDFKKALGEK